MSALPIPPVGPGQQVTGEVDVDRTGGAPAAGFAEALDDGLQQVSDLEHTADAMIEDVATGGPTKVHDMMVATTESSLATDLLVQVRDRGLEAYQEIMRLQL
ncbi:MAG: flagellar hook-basal body complex protein FliE [Nitriliruptoraceae bacterium]